MRAWKGGDSACGPTAEEHERKAVVIAASLGHHAQPVEARLSGPSLAAVCRRSSSASSAAAADPVRLFFAVNAVNVGPLLASELIYGAVQLPMMSL